MVLLIANKNLTKQEVVMISVGIDVAKGKSTVCILKPYGEIVPFLHFKSTAITYY